MSSLHYKYREHTLVYTRVTVLL